MKLLLFTLKPKIRFFCFFLLLQFVFVFFLATPPVLANCDDPGCSTDGLGNSCTNTGGCGFFGNEYCGSVKVDDHHCEGMGCALGSCYWNACFSLPCGGCCWGSSSGEPDCTWPGNVGDSCDASSSGLDGNYYAGKNFDNGLKLTRTDSRVFFDWGSGTFKNGMCSDKFSVRWTGYVKAPQSGSYVFSTYSDDGVRLWVNGGRIIDNWTDHGGTWNYSSGVRLTGGIWYPIKLEYYENGGGSYIRLAWEGSGT